MHPLRKLRESGPAGPDQYKELLAENVVFHSPLFVKEVVGRDLVAFIFAGSAAIREGRYVGEYKLDDRTTFLHWEGTIDGHELESLEVIVDDENGLIAERILAYRPYPALKLFRDRGLANPALKTLVSVDYFDYPEKLAQTEPPPAE